MTLNMKTYKGFNKLPYCSAHCPQAKHTTVADTPEAKRLAENTRIQSQGHLHLLSLVHVLSHISYLSSLFGMHAALFLLGPLPRVIENDISSLLSSSIFPCPPLVIHQMCGHISCPVVVPCVHVRVCTPSYLSAAPPPPPPNEDRPSRTLQSVRAATEYEMPANNNSPYSTKLQSTVIYTSEEGPVQTQPVRKVGSIADYDPLNDNYGSSAMGYNPPQSQQYYRGPAPAMQRVMPSQSQVPSGRTFRAMYDYVAQDVDEVSFLDGDMIVSCVPIDEGWMTGTVQRTGLSGMLPANYVEPIN
ncbi:hypothetical protein HPB50_007163 [Hyalomma asiaticum]|uniref:Uncharacterized protein n=1 Tax=Hyalomma asiaticum TaxID=266040 RepID=A0ACB7S856_HYAAI|nr:hypothetical protein HPB50_007163 [Hyalomma asiaticum]